METNLAYILFELTLYGFDEKEIGEAKDKLKEDLKDAIEEIETLRLLLEEIRKGD